MVTYSHLWSLESTFDVPPQSRLHLRGSRRRSSSLSSRAVPFSLKNQGLPKSGLISLFLRNYGSRRPNPLGTSKFPWILLKDGTNNPRNKKGNWCIYELNGQVVFTRYVSQNGLMIGCVTLSSCKTRCW